MKKSTRKVTILLVLVGTLGAVFPSRAQPVEEEVDRRDPPNILIFLTDDQRADRASMKVMPSTRRIFKRQGTFFPNAVATTPLCCPARSSLFSGKYAHNHGVHTNKDGENFNMDESMQALLHDHGYTTAYSGKLLNVPLRNPRHFDHWSIFRGGRKYYGARMNINGERRTVQGYLTSMVERKALDFLSRFESNDANPWYMVVAPYAAHAPATPERKYKGTSTPAWKTNPARREDSSRALRDKPSYVRSTQTSKGFVQKLRNRMLLSLKSADDMMARVFRKLRRTGEAKDTLAIFLSDNGYLWYEHGISQKRAPYAMSVEIPFYARWPGHLRAGSVDRDIVGNIDVAPTIYQVTGINPGYPVDGQSLFSTMHRNHILIESWKDPARPLIPKWAGIWTPSTKYVEYNTGFKEFYGRRDRWELRNLLGNGKKSDNPAKIPHLRSLLRGYRHCVAASCP
jgi:arylsulfatase A-like enzyme